MSDPEIIADEYLRPTQGTRQKKNALTLLRVLGGESSARRLAKEALENEDADVRRSAGVELCALEAKGDKQHAIEALLAEFTGAEDKRRRVRAYSLLGKLRREERSGTWLEGLRVATQLHLEAYPDKGFAFYARAVLPSLIGTVVAALLLLLYVAYFGVLRGQTGTVAGMILLYSLLAALVVPPLVTFRSLAFELYPDVLTGVVVECVTPLVALLPLCVVGYIVTYIVGDAKVGVGAFLLSTGALVAATIAVRLGTLAHGATRSVWMNFAIQAAAGGSLGASVLVGTLLLQLDGGLASYWVSLTPVTFGLAAAFALIDSRSPVANPRQVRPQSQVLAAAAMAGLTVLLALPFQRNSLAIGPESKRSISALPTTLRFSVANRTEVYFKVSSTAAEGADSVDTVARLLDGNGMELHRADDPEEFEQEVSPGVYTISIEPYDSEDQVSSQAGILTALFGISPASSPIALEATLRGYPLTKTTYKPTLDAPAVEPVETAVTQVPFVKFVKASGDTNGIHVGLVGESGESGQYEYSVYKGAEEIERASTEPRHLSFRDNSDEHMIVVRKKGSEFVPEWKNGEVITDTRPIEKGLVLSVEPSPQTVYQPLGTGITTIAGARADVDIAVTHIPFVHFVSVTGVERDVVLDLQQTSGSKDYVLQLFGGRDVQLAKEDDPETITKTLGPGLYWVVVHEYDELESVKRDRSGNVVLHADPVAPGLLLRIRLKRP